MNYKVDLSRTKEATNYTTATLNVIGPNAYVQSSRKSTLGGKIMSFARKSKGCETATILQILSIMGAVEDRQLRALFSHLSDQDYGRILYRMQRDGVIYRSKDAVYVAMNHLAMERTDLKSSVMSMWAFIHMKDKILDFCAGNPPAIMTFTAHERDYDLIPVVYNTSAVNESLEFTPDRTIRFLIVDSEHELSGLEFRLKNDYGVIVDGAGVRSILEIGR